MNNFSKKLEELLLSEDRSLVDLVKGRSDRDLLNSKSLLSSIYIPDTLISESPFLLEKENVEFLDGLLWNQFLSEENLMKIINSDKDYLLRDVLITQDLNEKFIKNNVDIEKFSKLLLTFQKLSINFIKDNLEIFKPHLSSCLKYQGFSKDISLSEFGIDPYSKEDIKRGIVSETLRKSYVINGEFLENCVLIIPKKSLEPKIHAIKKHMFMKMERSLYSLSNVRSLNPRVHKNSLKTFNVMYVLMDINVYQTFTKNNLISTVADQIRYCNASELIWRRNKERT